MTITLTKRELRKLQAALWIAAAWKNSEADCESSEQWRPRTKTEASNIARYRKAEGDFLLLLDKLKAMGERSTP